DPRRARRARAERGDLAIDPRPPRAHARPGAGVGRRRGLRVSDAAPAGGEDEMRVRSRAGAELPAERRELALELGQGPEALHDLELATVGQAPPRDLAARADGVTRSAEVRVVEEEHTAVRFQRALDELPEGLEAPFRDVGEP